MVTSSPQWHFNTRRACDKMRDPSSDAFFTAESLSNLSEALVREGIQNSLDARTGNRVKVCISIKSGSSPLCKKQIRALFTPSSKHFESGLSIQDLASLLEDNPRFLIFEDFGTRGLGGDIAATKVSDTTHNAFFSFFRAEGRSAKTGDNLGRWGIGKQVFPTASKLHSTIALTVRDEEPRKALMGSAIVKTHTVNNVDYQPDAWFGNREKSDDVVMPITKQSAIDSLIDCFGLKRKNETGLSIIVPALDERVSLPDLKLGAIESFFWPILTGALVVELVSDNETVTLDAETIVEHCNSSEGIQQVLRKRVELAEWASGLKPSCKIALDSPSSTLRPRWAEVGDELLTKEKLQEIRDTLGEEGRVCIRIPVDVRLKDKSTPQQRSFFEVYIESCKEHAAKPIFLRDGIVISDVNSPRRDSIRSLVVIDHRPLAGLLGDAEGVNHTQWQKDSPKFHNRYVYGGDTISFVTRAVSETMKRVHAEDTQGDPTLLIDIFSLPSEEGVTSPITKPVPGKNNPIVKLPPDIPEPKQRKWALNSTKGGFIVRPGKGAIEHFPITLRIAAAYDVRRGDALKRWSTDDFNFVRTPLKQIEKTGVNVERTEGNIIELSIRKPEFYYEIAGFDINRDLVVKATQIQTADETDI